MNAELLALARDVAAQGGALIRQMRGDGVEVAATKSSDVDVVTAADRACEDLIRRLVLDRRPDDGFVGEEGDDVVGGSGVRWIVDPIDGTVNYLYGIGQYAVSVAAEHRGQVVAGVVLNPTSGEEFHASRGSGAFLGDQRLQVRPAPPIGRTLVATGFGYEQEMRAGQGRAVAALLGRVRDIRRAGSCALDLCNVAAGRVDAYVEEGANYWDHAAGSLIATEAGARFELWSGAHGRDLIVCAADGGFDDFAGVVRDCGF